MIIKTETRACDICEVGNDKKQVVDYVHRSKDLPRNPIDLCPGCRFVIAKYLGTIKSTYTLVRP